MKQLVLRSIPYVLLAGVVACSSDPTADLRNGVAQLAATPTAIIVDSAGSQPVVVAALDEQGNAVDAKFSVPTVGAGLTVTFDTLFNPVYDAKGNLKPQNPATRVRYIVTGTGVGSSAFTVSAGSKSVDVSVRILPPAIPATISTLTPAPGDSIIITLPAGQQFAFDPADTASIGVTIGGNECTIRGVTADSTGVTCFPLPGSSGKPLLKGVILGFGSLAPVTVSATQAVSLPLPLLTYLPANPQPGDTLVVAAPAPYKFGTGAPVASDTSALVILGPKIFRTKRVADTLRYLIGPGADAPASVTLLRIPNFRGKSGSTFTINTAANLVTAALPVLTADKGGVLAAGDLITVTSVGRYKFRPTDTVLQPSVNVGLTTGTRITSISVDSLTLVYEIGLNADSSAPVIAGVRISGATGLGTFRIPTDKAVQTPPLAQFPATISNGAPPPNTPTTLTAGAGFTFSGTAKLYTGIGASARPAVILSQTANSITFIPIPKTGKGKPVVKGVLEASVPTIPQNLPAAVYVTPSNGTRTLAPGGNLDAENADETKTPFLPVPTPGNTVTVVDAGAYPHSSICDDTGNRCRVYRITVGASDQSMDFRARWGGPGDANGDGVEDGDRMDGSLYFWFGDRSDLTGGAGMFDCDAGGGGAPGGVPVGRGGESCTIDFDGPGTYYVVFALFDSATAANNVAPFELRIDITN